MTQPEETTPTASRGVPSKAFPAVSTLLIGAILVCGFFTGMAGKKVGGHEHLFFVIAYIFLGIVVVLIFGLAWVDTNTRGPDQGQRVH